MSYRAKFMAGLIEAARQAHKPEPPPAPAEQVEAAAIAHFRRALGYPEPPPTEEEP